MTNISIGLAVGSEQKALEALQWRASLANPGDRAALLAHPDAIELPLAQIESGQVFVAEQAGVIVGFCAICRAFLCDMVKLNWARCSSNPASGGKGLDGYWWITASK